MQYSFALHFGTLSFLGQAKKQDQTIQRSKISDE